MAYTQYFGSKPVSDWQANGPAESGHNFIDQINEQKGNVSAAENKYGEQQGVLNDARNTYQDLFKNQTGYSDLYGQAKTSEGVDDTKAQYQKSLASVNATQSVMNTLPSSINAGSNVVLTNAQRNAALGNQMAKYQNTLDYWTRQNQNDSTMYQTALASAQDLAKSNMAQEQAKVATALQDYQSQMNQINELYNQILQERQIMRSIYGDMYEDEYRHMQQEIEAWAQNLQAETSRYAQDQETARNNAKLAAEKYASDAGLRLQQYLQQQEADRTPTFLEYINSDANINNYPDDATYGENKIWAQRLANNYQNALNSNDYQALQNIYDGSVYQDYLKYIGR